MSNHSHISLRKIRRHRKYFRMMRRIVSRMKKSVVFRKAMCDLVVNGKSEMYIDLKIARAFL